jgi:hypothetical protein
MAGGPFKPSFGLSGAVGLCRSLYATVCTVEVLAVFTIFAGVGF